MINPARPADEAPWSTDDAARLYRTAAWGEGYFSINAAGHVEVSVPGQGPRVDLAELAEHGITVNAVAPGPTETDLFRQNNPVGSAGEARYLSAVPMRRFGEPAEVARANTRDLIHALEGERAATLVPAGGVATGVAATKVDRRTRVHAPVQHREKAHQITRQQHRV